MIPAQAVEAARYYYGTFFGMFPDWYQKHCIKKFMESEPYGHKEWGKGQ